MLGAGNVAHHLAHALVDAGHEISQIYNRSKNAGISLSEQVSSSFTDDIRLIKNNADLYILSVSDKAIEPISKLLNISNKKIVHTAGSVDISILNDAENHGVFYPLQTFSKKRKINFKEVPLCIEASNKEFHDFLLELASQLSDKVANINSTQRRQLHLSAVFACNFVNHLYAIADDLMDKSIPFEILHPLIKETALKAIEMNPEKAQTGPALRNDIESLEKHLELLSSYPEYQQIYKILSEDIYLKNK